MARSLAFYWVFARRDNSLSLERCRDTRRATRPKYFPSIRRAAERPTAKRRLMAKKSSRRPDHRRVKLHRTYSVDEVARLLDMHPNTVRTWVREGLPLLDSKRPQLIHGTDLTDFLTTPSPEQMAMRDGADLLREMPLPSGAGGRHSRLLRPNVRDGRPDWPLSNVRDADLSPR